MDIICFCGAGLLKLEFVVVPAPIVQATDFIDLHPGRRLRHQRLRCSFTGDEAIAVDGYHDLTCFRRAVVQIYRSMIPVHSCWGFE